MKQFIIHTYIYLGKNYISNRWLSNGWYDAALRLEYCLGFAKPYLSLDEQRFIKFVNDAFDYDNQKPHAFILDPLGSDYSPRLTIQEYGKEKKVF